MSRAKRAAVWTYVVGRREESWGIETMRIIFRRKRRADAADDVAEAIRYSWSEDGRSWHIKRADALRASTGQTAYYEGQHNDYFEMSWQSNIDGNNGDEWYAGHVSDAQLQPDVIAAIARIMKAKGDRYGISPDEVIACLKAVPVTYCDGANVHVACDAPDLSTTAQKRKQSTEAA